MKMNPNNGKGSKQRPTAVTQDKFLENWQKIFGINGENPKKYKWKKTKHGNKLP
jgi:hypothetical protein